jgi:hypothetical protein
VYVKGDPPLASLAKNLQLHWCDPDECSKHLWGRPKARRNSQSDAITIAFGGFASSPSHEESTLSSAIRDCLRYHGLGRGGGRDAA